MGSDNPSPKRHRTTDSLETVMSHSLRFPSRLLAVLGATATLIVLAATTASALVAPLDPAGSGGGAAPIAEATSSHAGLTVAVIIATVVLAVAVAGLLLRRSGRMHAARLAASTT
jgi:hypothetical protein